MPTIWDLWPASMLPAQPFIPPIDPAPPPEPPAQQFAVGLPTPYQLGRYSWLAAPFAAPPDPQPTDRNNATPPTIAAANQSGGATGPAATPQPQPASFWDLLPATPHGHPFVPVVPPTQSARSLLPSLGAARPVTPGAQVFFSDADRADDSRGILGRLAPVVAPGAAGEASEGALASRFALAPVGATGALAAAMLLAMMEPMGDSTRKFPQRDDPEYRPQYVLRGGLSMPNNLRVDELSKYGLPGLFGISSASAPNMTVDEIARRAQFQNGQMTYTTKRDINRLGYPVEPTGPQTRLHHSIMLQPGKDVLSDAQREALSALFRQHILPNPYRPLPP